MTKVTPQLVKELRDRTGIGMGKCKEALEEANGDIELAIANLRKAGMATAVKKEGRETKEGVILVAEKNATVALVEVNAETDFVVKNEHFQQFARDLLDEVCKTMPATMEEFLNQKFSKDSALTIDEYRASLIQRLGENIQIRRFELFPKKADTTLVVYTHGGGKLVTVVELTGSSGEEVLGKDLAMHVAAESPEYLNSEEIPQRVLEHEKEIARAQLQGKPANMMDKIVEGKLKAYFDQVCFLNQKFFKDPSLTVAALVEKRGKEIKKPLKISYFIRWKVGE